MVAKFRPAVDLDLPGVLTYEDREWVRRMLAAADILVDVQGSYMRALEEEFVAKRVGRGITSTPWTPLRRTDNSGPW